MLCCRVQVKDLQQRVAEDSRDAQTCFSQLAQVVQLLESGGGRVPLKGEVDRARSLVTAARRSIRRIACGDVEGRAGEGNRSAGNSIVIASASSGQGAPTATASRASAAAAGTVSASDRRSSPRGRPRSPRGTVTNGGQSQPASGLAASAAVAVAEAEVRGAINGSNGSFGPGAASARSTSQARPKHELPRPKAAAAAANKARGEGAGPRSDGRLTRSLQELLMSSDDPTHPQPAFSSTLGALGGSFFPMRGWWEGGAAAAACILERWMAHAHLRWVNVWLMVCTSTFQALTPDLFASLPVSTVVYAAHQHQQNGLQVDTQRLAQRHRPIGILPGLGSCACTAAFRVAQRRRRPACVCRQASADGQLPLNLQLEEREAIKENKDRVLVEELGEGDFCIVPELLIASDKKRPGVQMDTYKMLRDSLAVLIFYFLPVLGPVFAFWQWKNILLMVHFILGDERQLLELMQVTLTPATNGIVISSLAIAFGTLTSVTISSLRQRQKEVRQSLNKEACELALLQAMLVANIGPVRNARRTQDTALHLQSLEFLELYVARLHSESTAEASSSFLQRQSVADSELMAILNTLRYCTTKPPSFTFYPVRDEATMRIVRLNDFRADRLASINTGFPPLHWVILALLAASISLCFLIEKGNVVETTPAAVTCLWRPMRQLGIRETITAAIQRPTYSQLASRGQDKLHHQSGPGTLASEAERTMMSRMAFWALKHSAEETMLTVQLSPAWQPDEQDEIKDDAKRHRPALSRARQRPVIGLRWLLSACSWRLHMLCQQQAMTFGRGRRDLLMVALRKGGSLEDKTSGLRDDLIRKDVIIHNLRQEQASQQQEAKQQQQLYEQQAQQQQHLDQLQQVRQLQEMQEVLIQQQQQLQLQQPMPGDELMSPTLPFDTQVLPEPEEVSRAEDTPFDTQVLLEPEEVSRAEDTLFQ
ncbi:unnamed protein product [Polarella glacialis]|uniref:Uncharacterized protein n=1 Tax=Polarella glacialis TaxID=89957 RepID=A0A813HA32_POLGL|nr:unnamed protein product [Polarella glacialis]